MDSSATILIVEDNPDDYEACFTALTQDHNLANPIYWCKTGDEALDYLCGNGAFAENKPAMPCLIMLDLNLPGTDGRQVLAQIKHDEMLRKIPVIVMTSSSDQADIDACYREGANSYVVKPVDLNGFIEAITRLRDYWFQIVVLPQPMGT
ncbi:response regulator [Phaeobacter sp. G2]|jgi:two-component system response regulator|nr:response regulator [Phaeobacter sp. G2]